MNRSMPHGDRLIDYSTDWVADGVFPTISRLNFSCGANIQGILPISIARGNLRLRRCRWIAPGCRSGGNLTAARFSHCINDLLWARFSLRLIANR
jgi:hypothetical protein